MRFDGLRVLFGAVMLSLIGLLSGCDHFYGPHLYARVSGITVAVRFQGLKEETTYVTSACINTFVGRADVNIESIVLMREGRTLAQYDQKAVQEMLRLESQSRGRQGLIVDETGVHMAPLTPTAPQCTSR